MVVADSSVWIAHFRSALPELPQLLAKGQLRINACIIGELALGSVPDRERLIKLLQSLPCHELPDDLVSFVERNALYSTGIGYVDAMLLRCCEASGDQLWTFDKRLQTQAERLGLAHMN